MFFLLKCLFWLALVYAAILYGIGPLGSFAHGRVAGEKPARGIVEPAPRLDPKAMHTAVEAAGAIGGLCANRPSECFAGAARLTGLFKSNSAEEPTGSVAGSPRRRRPIDGRAIETQAGDAIASRPVPVPDPRRQVRALKLTPKV